MISCLDESVAGELVCPSTPTGPDQVLPWVFTEIPYTGLDVLTLCFIAVALIALGVAVLRLKGRSRR